MILFYAWTGYFRRQKLSVQETSHSGIQDKIIVHLECLQPTLQIRLPNAPNFGTARTGDVKNR